MPNTLRFCPAVPAHQQATCSSNSIASWSKLHPGPFSTPRQRRQDLARGALLAVAAGKKVLVPVANGSEEMEAVMLPHFLSRALALL